MNTAFKGTLSLTISIISLTIFSINISWGCEFETDCKPGNECIKPSGSMYGVCTGGINPGNSYDKRPVYSSTDPNHTTGNTCSFDTDCGPGSTCLKDNSLEGACVQN